MTVTQVSTVNFDSTGGDSGGAVFKYVCGGTTGDVYALGTHVHSEPDGPSADEGWFSGINEGEDDFSARFSFDYTVCQTPAC